MSETEQATEEVKTEKPKSEIKPMSLGKNSEMVAKDTSELMRQIGMLMQGQAFPKTFDTPAKVVAAWNLAASFKNVSPQRAIAKMMFINGTISIWGELPYTLAEGTGEVEDYQVYVVDKDYLEINQENKNYGADPFAAVCKIKRKGKTKNEFFFTIDEAEKAGLLKKQGPWQVYAKTMLMWRASGLALRFIFGDALMGASIAEYDHTLDFARQSGYKDVTPEITKNESSLNETFNASSYSQVAAGQGVGQQQ